MRPIASHPLFLAALLALPAAHAAPTALAGLGGGVCTAAGVNDSGAATGQCRSAAGDFLPTYWAAGSSVALPLRGLELDGPCEALGIARDGQIAGNCELGEQGERLPVVWRAPSLPSALPEVLNGRTGDDRAAAVAINAAGAVVGISTSPGGKDVPVIWKSGQTAATSLPVPGTLPPLLTPVTECRVMALDSAATPAAVGSCDLRQGGVVAVRWTANALGGYSVTMLPGVPGGSGCIATAINAAGYIAGTCEDAVGDMAAVRWRPTLGAPALLRGLPRDAAAGQQVFAADIGASGLVVGNYIAGDGRSRSFVWAPADAPANEDALDLGLLGGSQAYARQIADNGRILGMTDTAQGAQIAFSWTPTNEMQDLGTLGGHTNLPAAMSANGAWIVGVSTDSAGHRRAYRIGPSKNAAAARADTAAASEGISEGGYPSFELINPMPACSDKDSRCSTWINNGFCSSTFYTVAQKAQYCAASCRLCGK
ncbi:hypothetical protein J5226_01545 [Lysobacter sp. K5869]|uniref:hypothetical protein n=1 Tax=Lysobacter sp. K5869 TaxID=2820808 RepID=UPI001C0628D4|nr:hypothetical protein [Lysobacter sp. K5869]QWP77116.1 hypothetical protein J5226_01545 [Lysobacter sp. K5869]